MILLRGKFLKYKKGLVMDLIKLENNLKKIENQFISVATGKSDYSNLDLNFDFSSLREEVLKEFYNSKDMEEFVPSLIKEFIDLKKFWFYIKKKYDHYDERRIYIYDNFSKTYQCIEIKKYSKKERIIIPNIGLSTEYIEETIKKAKDRINDEDYSGAITIAKTLSETVLLEIYKKYNDGRKPEGKPDLNKLYNLIKKFLSLDPSSYAEKDFKQILSGLNSITQGIAELRNKFGDAHREKIKPQKHHADLMVNASFTLCQFLSDTYFYQKQKKKEQE
ncbi:MAG: hypothetical protein EOM53_00015 [Alphaproteobacteria bacterium]|nr:hypothetical protein [Alphaproteobacteria bacterium]